MHNHVLADVLLIRSVELAVPIETNPLLDHKAIQADADRNPDLVQRQDVPAGLRVRDRELPTNLDDTRARLGALRGLKHHRQLERRTL